jgi:hypothetical protein
LPCVFEIRIFTNAFQIFIFQNIPIKPGKSGGSGHRGYFANGSRRAGKIQVFNPSCFFKKIFSNNRENVDPQSIASFSEKIPVKQAGGFCFGLL